jgi:hypothetical protein
VQSDEGWLSWDVRPVASRARGRTRLGFLDGRPISDDELELRLADLERLRRSA